MLQHAQPGLYLPCLDLLVDRILHAEPPAVVRIPHQSGMSIGSYTDEVRPAQIVLTIRIIAPGIQKTPLIEYIFRIGSYAGLPKLGWL
jgi:hypothetical protein